MLHFFLWNIQNWPEHSRQTRQVGCGHLLIFAILRCCSSFVLLYVHSKLDLTGITSWKRKGFRRPLTFRMWYHSSRAVDVRWCKQRNTHPLTCAVQTHKHRGTAINTSQRWFNACKWTTRQPHLYHRAYLTLCPQQMWSHMLPSRERCLLITQ